MKRVLITGATGFLGKYLVDIFYEHKYEVIATGRNTAVGKTLERDRVTFIACDLRNKSEVFKLLKDIDVLVHAAALSSAWGQYQDFYESNVLSTKHIVDGCLENDISKLIFVSSPSIYASTRDQLSIKECEAPKTNNLNYYIKTKLLAEEEIQRGHRDGLYTVIIRPRGLFGIGDPSIVPRILEVNEKMGIPLFNDGQQRIDITFVSNVAYSILLAAEKDNINGEIFNITNDDPLTFKEIISLLFKHIDLEMNVRDMNPRVFYGIASLLESVAKTFRFKKEPILTRYKASTLLYSQTLCIDNAKEKLGYKPLVSVEEGIKIYAKWWNEHAK